MVAKFLTPEALVVTLRPRSNLCHLNLAWNVPNKISFKGDFMKSIFVLLLASVISFSCGKDDKKSGGGATNQISSNMYAPSTVEGYLTQNGMLIINNTTYQMVSSLSSYQINQQFQQSGAQPTLVNGQYAFRAMITGALYNPCQAQTQQYPSYPNQNCSLGMGGMQSNMFYVTNLQFLR